jgi:UPF0755 protein
MKQWRERSAQEREAARLERERRRAQQRGGPMTPAPAASEPAAPPAPAREAVARTPSRPLPVIEGAAPLSVGAESESLQPADGNEPEPLGGAAFKADGESPAGTKRVSGLDRTPSRPRATRQGRPPIRVRGSGSRAPRSPRGRALAVMAIVLAVALIWFLVQLFQPFHGAGSGKLTVRIPAHSTSSQIGDQLAAEGVISSSFFFELRATLAGERGDLRSGTFHLARDMSYGDVLKILTTAPPAARVTDLTVIEGRTRRQLDTLLRSQGVRGSYLAATRHSSQLDPAGYGAPRGIGSLEGFLFPSTYQLREPISLAALVSDQLKTFRQQFKQVHLGYAKRKHLTPYDVLTIGSIIQGEARTARDQSLISSVIYNRLKAHMRLQMDDTVRFATGNYEHPITVSQLALRSPWNTYTHDGLPVTPIDSPGLAAIQAAAHPANTNYLFFVVKPCGNGAHAFASSYAQFQVLQNRYQAARTQRGGRSPAFCH